MHDEALRFVSAADGLPIQAYCWRPAGAPAGVVVIAHGLAEHAQRYDRFARTLAGAGLVSHALDHRGHGASIGPGGLGDLGAGGWDALVADVGQLIGIARAAYPDLPLALFGHSMGSFAAQQYCFARSDSVDAVVLSGSTTWESLPKGASGFEPNRAFEPARTPYDWLSRDPAEVDKYIEDPLCGFESLRPRAPQSVIDLNRVVDPEGPRGIRPELPVLLLAGDEDPLNRKLEGLALLERRWRQAGVGRIDKRYYHGGRHEMLNEINRDEVTRDILDWLRNALALS